jgi:hypothetical protein
MYMYSTVQYKCENLFPVIIILGAFCHQGKFNIFKIYVKFCVFWYPLSLYREEKKFRSLYTVVHVPESRNLAHKGQLIQNFLFIFYDIIFYERQYIYPPDFCPSSNIDPPQCLLILSPYFNISYAVFFSSSNFWNIPCSWIFEFCHQFCTTSSRHNNRYSTHKTKKYSTLSPLYKCSTGSELKNMLYICYSWTNYYFKILAEDEVENDEINNKIYGIESCKISYGNRQRQNLLQRYL